MSGKLIMNALVMYDRQTGTLWSQFLGRGVSGPLSGTPLKMIPVTLTTWDRWLAEYPDTVALDKSKGHYIGGYVFHVLRNGTRRRSAGPGD